MSQSEFERHRAIFAGKRIQHERSKEDLQGLFPYMQSFEVCETNEDFRVSLTKLYHRQAFKDHPAKDQFSQDLIPGDFYGEDKQVILYFQTSWDFDSLFNFYRGTYGEKDLHWLYAELGDDVHYNAELYEELKKTKPRCGYLEDMAVAFGDSECTAEPGLEDKAYWSSYDLEAIEEAMFIHGDRAIIYSAPAYNPDTEEALAAELSIFFTKYEPEILREFLTGTPLTDLGDAAIEHLIKQAKLLFDAPNPEIKDSEGTE